MRQGVDSPSIAASLIIRNEERHLPDCLDSIIGIVDEIVVVDTGSTDASMEIARSFGATVIETVWRDDFAAARNLALEHCTADWILSIDADERLTGVNKGSLKQALSAPDHVAFRPWLRQRPLHTPCREYRVFRNDPRIRFRNRLHENAIADIKAVADTDRLYVGVLEALLEHIGYEGDQTAKHERYLLLLRRAIETSPDRVYLWWHLGFVLKELGRITEAEDAWMRGIEVVSRTAATDSTSAFMPYVALLDCRLERDADVAGLLAEAKERLRPNHHLSFAEARYLISAGRYAEAIPLLNGLAAIDPKGFRDEEVAYDYRLFGENAYEALATCHFQLGDFAESARWYARAEETAPERLDLRVKRIVAASRVGR